MPTKLKFDLCPKCLTDKRWICLHERTPAEKKLDVGYLTAAEEKEADNAWRVHLALDKEPIVSVEEIIARLNTAYGRRPKKALPAAAHA